MEIILKQDVENLGHKDDIVAVRNGYANNFLIPQGLAVVATPSAKKMHACIFFAEGVATTARPCGIRKLLA